MDNIFLNTLNGKLEERPPVWFMRQAGRILPSYSRLKETHKFYDMMKDAELTSKVTMIPVIIRSKAIATFGEGNIIY